MLDKSPKIITGIIAFSIYFILLGLVVFYFNSKSFDKPKHYVKKNEHRIQVSLSTVKKTKKIKNNPRIKSKPKVKNPKKSKPKVKKELKKKRIKEKVIKKPIKKKEVKVKKIPKKIIKKKEKKIEQKIQKKLNKQKKVKTIDLFTNIKTKDLVKSEKKEKLPKKKAEKKQKPIKKRTISASEHIRNTLKKQTIKDKGIENAYFSKVQTLLETWPAQSEFAGEKAVVRISVAPTGKFDFKVQTQSNNMDFNKELIAFLKQLQRIGLGKHHAGRNYEFNVEFIAKE